MQVFLPMHYGERYFDRGQIRPLTPGDINIDVTLSIVFKKVSEQKPTVASNPDYTKSDLPSTVTPHPGT